MTHIETLEFELQALKNVLESQIAIKESYHESYERNYSKLGLDHLNTQACRSVLMEYRDKHIPRTERHIEALTYILERYHALANNRTISNFQK